MRSALYVGRVGALAVALGIGAVIAGVPGPAWAGPEGESEPSDTPGVSASENPDGSAEDVSDTDVGGGDLGDPGSAGGLGNAGDVDGADDSAGGMQVASSGGAITSTTPGSAGAESKQTDRDTEPPKKRSTVKPKDFSLAPSLTKTTTQSTAKTVAEPGRKVRLQAPTLSIAPPKDPGPQIKQSTNSPVDVAPLTLAAPGLQKPEAARMTAVTKPLAQSSVLRLLPFVTLAPTADGKQPGSTESPLLLGFLAAGRRVDKKASTEDESIARTVDSMETSLALKTAAAPLTSVQTKATRSPATKRDTKAPTVNLASPANGALVSGTVTLSAYSADNVGVTGVQFSVDSTAVGAEGTGSPYIMSWDTTAVTDGPHTLTASAHDDAGNITISTVNVTVDNTKPTVTLAAPANGALVSGTVTLNATAADNFGVTGVQFLVDDTPLGAEDTSSSYSASWDTTAVTDGPHTLTARARDDAGNITISTVNVTVDNEATTIPATVTSIPVNSYPTAVAFSGDSAFVYGGDVIWTIDTRTNTVTDWTALYNEPAVVSPDGTRRYVAGYMSVSVVDNETGAVIDTVDLPNCDYCGYGWSAGVQELAVSPDGTRLYARHAYPVDYAPVVSAVAVIDTSTFEIVGTAEYLYAKDLEIAVDGTVYAIDEDYYYSDVNVYDRDMRYLDTIRLSSQTGTSFSSPTTLAISSDRKHAFVHVYDWDSGGMTVSIIDTDPASPTYNTETFLTERYSAVSPDGSRLYVPEPDGKTITVYDTATNAKVGSFTTDNQPNTSSRGIYFAPNGTLYIADPGDNTLYAVTIGGTTVV
jgi:hypothetical protein